MGLRTSRASKMEIMAKNESFWNSQNRQEGTLKTQALTAVGGETFLERAWVILWSVPSPTFISTAISSQDLPGRAARRPFRHPRRVWAARSPCRSLLTISDGGFTMALARVAEWADARDLKSLGEKSPCRFDPGPGHVLDRATRRFTFFPIELFYQPSHIS